MITSSRQWRVKQTAEVFTPASLTTEIIEKLPEESWLEGKTFIDPAVGNGNLLVMVFWKKITKGHNVLKALDTIFGLDIMTNNIKECRFRLLDLVKVWEPITKKHVEIVLTNIKLLTKKKYPNGSLDYDYKFEKAKDRDVDRWFTDLEKMQPILGCFRC